MDPDVKRLFEEFKQFNDGLINRFDLSMKRIDRRADAQAVQMLEQAVEMREQAAAMRAQATEMREQAGAMRAIRESIEMNTAGLLRVFQRLDAMEGNA